MSVVHRMTGYHKATEMLEIEYCIPEDKLREAYDLAHIPTTDAEAVGSYPLDMPVARRLAATIGEQVNLDRYDWFMEAFAG